MSVPPDLLPQGQTVWMAARTIGVGPLPLPEDLYNYYWWFYSC